MFAIGFTKKKPYQSKKTCYAQHAQVLIPLSLSKFVSWLSHIAVVGIHHDIITHQHTYIYAMGYSFHFFLCRGWLGEAKVSCILRHRGVQLILVGVVGWSKGVMILHHRGVQLILAYSWARPAILVAGKGRRGMFLFLLFLHFHSFFFSPVPLFHLLCYLFYLFSLSLGDDTKWPTRVDVLLNPNSNFIWSIVPKSSTVI